MARSRRAAPVSHISDPLRLPSEKEIQRAQRAFVAHTDRRTCDACVPALPCPLLVNAMVLLTIENEAARIDRQNGQGPTVPGRCTSAEGTW